VSLEQLCGPYPGTLDRRVQSGQVDSHKAFLKQADYSTWIVTREQDLRRVSGRHRFRLLPGADWGENVTHLGPS